MLSSRDAALPSRDTPHLTILKYVTRAPPPQIAPYVLLTLLHDPHLPLRHSYAPRIASRRANLMRSAPNTASLTSLFVILEPQLASPVSAAVYLTRRVSRAASIDVT